MNILYIGDPNSIHDKRWISFFAEKQEIKCFLVARHSHLQTFNAENRLFNSNVTILASIGDPSTLRPWKNWHNVFKIRKLIRKHQIDLLHILYAEPNSLWANWKWVFKVPVVITTHGTDILKTIPEFFRQPGILNKLVSRQYRKALNHTDHITCTSFHQIDNLKKLEIIRPVTIVRTGVDFGMINKSREFISHLIDPEKPFVLMPRNMKPIYNHEFTLDGISLLDPVLKKKYVFVFLDSQTKDQIYFKRIYQKALKIDADIRFLNSLSHPELLSLVRQSALVVMNPVSDGSPVTAMEAMAYKVPVILPPLNYDVDVFSGAWRFDEWTARSLKTKMEEVLRADSRLIASAVENNFQKIFRHGNAEIEMGKLMGIYRNLIPV